jgi:2-dehydro-3-deoxyphosphooctonate aldolase (KDO 8-P synthase)
MKTLILGPCVVEHSAQWLVDQAGRIKEIVDSTLPGAKLIFKASFDKANRSTLDGLRGIGIQEGLEALSDVRKIYGIRVTTDIHEPWQAPIAAEHVDLIQIPAMLARQTDLLRSATFSKASLSIKVPVWADASEATSIIVKYGQCIGQVMINKPQPLLIYRGTQYGPGKRNLRMDWEVASALPAISPTIIDLTHTNGRSWLESLSNASRVLSYSGFQGLFMETHPAPAQAWCDGLHQLSFAKLTAILEHIAPNFFGGQVPSNQR